MNKKYYGTLMAVLSALSWSFSGVLGRMISWNPITVSGLRALIAAAFLGMIRRSWRVRPSKGTILGAIGVSATSLCYFIALRYTSAANAIVLEYAMTAFVILFCWIFYRQRPRRLDLITAIAVMGGVVLCSVQGMKSGQILGDVFGILSAIAFSLVFFCARMPGTKPADYAFLGNAVSALLALSAFTDPNVGSNPMDWLFILLMGLGQTGGYYFLCKATGLASPLSVALTINIEPVLNPLWVFLFLGEFPGWFSFAGAAVVLGAITIYSIRGGSDKQ